MSRDILRAALVRHIAAERARDIDAIMASLHPDPFYIMPGYEMRGAVAVRALYEMAWAALTPENADEYLRALDDPGVAIWGEDHVVLVYTPDYPIHYGMTVVAQLVDGMLRSEHTYVSLQREGGVVPQFEGVPGATPIVPAGGARA